MENMEDRPWIAGPLELLRHGLNHKNNTSDFDSRIAFISIDNGVELMIKTYLSLPKRITKIEGLSRKKYEEIAESFPQLVNALEDYAGEQVEGIDLGKIEWFHQLRNTLYHQGNGITVEKRMVERYFTIAAFLLSKLFEVPMEDIIREEKNTATVGEFIKLWGSFEKSLTKFKEQEDLEISRMVRLPATASYRRFMMLNKFAPKDLEDYDSLRRFRLDLVHGMADPSEVELKEQIAILRRFIAYFESTANIKTKVPNKK